MNFNLIKRSFFFLFLIFAAIVLTPRPALALYFEGGSYDGYSSALSVVPPTIEAPSNFTAVSASTTRLNYAWTDNATDESGFDVLDGSSNIKVSVAANITSTFESGLSVNTQYTRKVQSFNSSASSTSAAVSVYTSIEAAAGATYEGVTDISITIHSSNAPSNLTSGSSGIYFENVTKGTNSGWIQSNSWTSSDLTANTAYSFNITTRNGEGAITATFDAGSQSTLSKTSGEATISTGGVRLINGDIIGASSRIEAGFASSGIDIMGFKLYIDDTAVSDGLNGNYDTYETAGGQTTVYYTPKTALSRGTHNIRTTAYGSSVNYEGEVNNLKVMSNDVAEVVGAVLPYPNPYDPDKGSVKITYNLAGDAGIKIYIFNLTGQLVWTNVYAAGSNGGKAGYNEVLWNGADSFGSVVGNGIFPVRIVNSANGTVIGRSKIAVLAGVASGKKPGGVDLAVLALLSLAGLTATGGMLNYYRVIKKKKRG